MAEIYPWSTNVQRQEGSQEERVCFTCLEWERYFTLADVVQLACGPLIYNEEEKFSWEVVIVLPGVEVIPKWTFLRCEKLETVIIAGRDHTVKQARE